MDDLVDSILLYVTDMDHGNVKLISIWLTEAFGSLGAGSSYWARLVTHWIKLRNIH